MNTTEIEHSSAGAVELLGAMRAKGVQIWSAEGQLRYRAPKGALTSGELQALRAFRAQIVNILEQSSGADIEEPEISPRDETGPAPLSFTQLAHWNLYRMGELPAARFVSSVIRLRGPLDVEALRRSVSHVVLRHEALRTRIVVVEGRPLQETLPDVPWTLRIEDLGSLPESDLAAEVLRIFNDQVFEPVDPGIDPLFVMRLLRIRQNEHVLIVAIAHIVSDGFSLHLMFRDLFSAYEQAASGHAISLGAPPLQMADYSTWQQNTRSAWLQTNQAWWDEHLLTAGRLRFPLDRCGGDGTTVGMGLVRFQIDRELKMELREWCRERRATLAMTVFAAYVAFLLRWCRASKGIIRFQTDGRVQPQLRGTIGYFAFPLYFRIAMPEHECFSGMVNRITREYCEAYEHADFSWLAAQTPAPEFTRSSCFNWLAQDPGAGAPGNVGGAGALECSRVAIEGRPVEGFELDVDPLVGLIEGEEDVSGGVQFPQSRFSVGTMERFTRSFLWSLRAFVRNPDVRIKELLPF